MFSSYRADASPDRFHCFCFEIPQRGLVPRRIDLLVPPDASAPHDDQSHEGRFELLHLVWEVAALAIWASALKRVGAGPQRRELGGQVAALHQPGIALGHLEQGVLTLAPEADVELVSAEMQIVHGEIGQPLRQPWVDVEFVAQRVG